MSENKVNVMAQKKSLLEKYGIPVENLDFDFIQNCENRKRIEQILAILRSCEEGFYPELTVFTENRLRELFPASKLLYIDNKVSRNDHPKCSEAIEGLKVICYSLEKQSLIMF